MANLYYDLSKYIMAVLFALYTLESFLSLGRDASGRKGSMRQYFYIFLIHLSGFFVLCLKNEDYFYLLFFAVQQAVLLIMRNLYQMFYPRFQRTILNHMCMFLCVGMIMISRISMTKAIRQFAIIVISMVIGLFIPLLIKRAAFLRRLTWAYALLGLLALGVVLVLGATTNGSKISYAIFGFTFQPSEFVKLLFIFFLAAYFSGGLNWKKILVSACVSLLYLLILAASTDLGSAAIFFVIYVFLLYIASGKFRYLLFAAAAGAGGCAAAYKMFYHIKVRVAAWLDPWRDVTGKGYQMVQSLFAIGTGGWFGFGLCQGTPESIPYVEADFIFSAISEELGALFGICLILLCLGCFLAFVRIAYGVKDCFSRLLAYGIAVTYIFQVFLTIGGGIKFIPLTGVTLPLVSYGGSSVMVTILMFSVMQGIVLRQSELSEEEEDAAADMAVPAYSGEAADTAVSAYNGEAADTAVSADTGEAMDKAVSADIGEVVDMPASAYNGETADTEEVTDIGDREDIEEPEDDGEWERIEEAQIDEEAQDTVEVSKTAGGGRHGKTNDAVHMRPQTVLTAGIFAALFLAMSGYIIYFMGVQREAVVTHPYNVTRQQALARLNVRGTIKTESGDVLAYTKLDEEGNEVRRYPYESMYAHVVGYAANGGMGIEASMAYNLVSCHQSVGGQIANDFGNVKNKGDTVVTTLNPELQEVAYRLLGASDGAVIVMEPSTGKILAMVSKPDFDPNRIEEIWDEILEDEESSVLVNRATQGLYPPGSTFKIYTALEYIREHPNTYDDYHFSCAGYYQAEDGNTIHCYGHSAHGGLSFEESFARSCNSSFANIGMTLDRRRFGETLADFYFNAKLPGAFETNMGRITMSNAISEYDMLQASIGQGETLITPLQLCLTTCAIANGGELMQPYVVSRVENYEGVCIRAYEPQSAGSVMSAGEAAELTELMKAVCDYGTGYRLSEEPYVTAGKTGSAEFDASASGAHAWFTGFAPADDPQIVVTIIVEEAGVGGDYAVPIAQRIFQTYFDEIAKAGNENSETGE